MSKKARRRPSWKKRNYRNSYYYLYKGYDDLLKKMAREIRIETDKEILRKLQEDWL